MTASFWTLRPTKSSTSALALSLLLFASTRAQAADDFAKRVTKAQQCYEKKLYEGRHLQNRFRQTVDRLKCLSDQSFWLH